MMRSWFRRLVRDETGSMVVVAAAAALGAATLTVGVLEGGRWLQTRRHLQTRTDAAALAAGQALNACFNIGTGFANETAADAFIENAAQSYGGVDYNKQFGRGTTSYVFQRNSFSPPFTTTLGPECFKPDGTPNLMVDVKGTQSGISPFFFSRAPLATTHAWARVELQVIKDLKPAMPLAIPDVNPKHVAVTFVDDSTGDALTGCTAPTLGTCTFALTGPTPSGILNGWSGSASFPVPAADKNVGMRVSIGPANGNCAHVAATTTFTCYDYSSNHGILAVRSYSSAVVGAVGTPALLRQVTPTTCLQGNIAGGTPYFSTYQTAANGNCDRVGVTANVDFPAAVNPNTRHVTYAIVQGACPNQTNKYTDMNQPPSGSNTWTSNLTMLPAGDGIYNVCMAWSYGSGSNQNSGFFNAQNPVQQIFSASDGTDPSRPGGPIMSAGLTGPANPYSFTAGSTANVNVMIGLTGGVHVNPKCPNAGTGKNYNCATDPVILLRTANTSGSLNYAIDCGQVPGHTGGNLYQMMRYGCANSFSINNADICPDTPVPVPTDCAPVMTGDKTGQVKQALNDRLGVGNNGCSPNNYPNTSIAGDQRIVMLVDTDFSAYLGTSGGSTSSDVPVVTFATFYITGWDGASPACAALNEAAPPNSDTKGNSSNLWGHFISFETNGTPSGIKCAGNSVVPCVAALVR